MNAQEQIAQAVAMAVGMEAEAILPMLETPPDPAMGDYALPCFKLAKTLRKAPPAISDGLAATLIKPDCVQRVESVMGYLNFYLVKEDAVRRCLEEVFARGDRFGWQNEGRGKKVCIDFSSINIAKRFHIGHLSTTVIGHALSRIYTAMGYQAVRINHLGDWGTQFGKMLCAYKLWGDRQTVEKGGVEAMTDLYVRFDREANKNPELEELGRAWFKRIENGDPEALEIFNWFKEVTLKDALRVYNMLGIEFDSYAGESFYADKTDAVVEELREKKLLVESEGAEVVPLGEDMPPCMILKKDGATLYTTRDIAAALYRKRTYDFAKCLYIVAYQQNLHFRQFFKVIELMGYPWHKDLEHVSFGMVSYEGQTLSTRKGVVVYLDELLERAVEKAGAIIEEKNPGLAEKDEVARQVGIGSVLFATLFNSRIKDIDFWWDRALSFEGEAAPYVQYAHARCASLLRKGGYVAAVSVDYSQLQDEEALALVKAIAVLPETVALACRRNEPYLVTRAALAIAKTFNKFYFACRVIDPENPAATTARLALTAAAKQAIANALYLVGIESPEEM